MSLKRVGAAAVILNDDGHVLMVKHNYGLFNWEIPGGRSEDNESPIQTAVREVREETGLVVEAVHMTGVYYIQGSDALGFVFRCRIVDGEPSVKDPDEITDCRYWPVDALPRPISNWTVRRILDAADGPAQPLPIVLEPVALID